MGLAGSSSCGIVMAEEEEHEMNGVKSAEEGGGGILALTCSAGGLQLIWSTMFSHGSAYLLTLGITPSQSSLIWAAAPVCGALVPPLAGIWSDNCRLRYGRRRPFIVGGAACAVICLLALAWIEEIGPWFSIAVLAILLVILLNIAIQTFQLGIRALIVDTYPPEQQPHASAWVNRFTGIGSIIGYFAASIPINAPLGEEETRRFRLMALLAAVAVTVTVAATVFCVQEHSVREDLYEVQSGNCLARLSMKIASGIRDMPPKAKWVCKVQFFSCMAWFGFLFYSSTYVSGLLTGGEHQHFATISLGLPSDSMAVGSSANLLFAIVSFGTSVILPWFVDLFLIHPERTGDISEKTSSSNEAESSILPAFWAIGNLLYSASVLATVLITYSFCGIILVGVVGVSWAIQNWVPFAIISTELSSHQEMRYELTSLEAGSKRLQRDASSDSAVMMGLHSAAMSVPQIIAALLTSGIFEIAKAVGHEEHAVGWMLRTSAAATLVAVWFIYRGAKEHY